ncbi:hypothetical protein ABPG74_006596 [Tetrahymena malaccensis]
MDKDLKQQIKTQCPFLHLSDITLILKFLNLNKPHLEILRDHKIKSRTLTTYNQYFNLMMISMSNIPYQCLQLTVFDKKSGIKKIIEVFLVEQMQSQIEQFVKHVQLCKSLIRTDLVLKIFDSYFLDDPGEADQQLNQDENLYYAIEYEYFDYSNRDILNNSSVRQNTYFQTQFLNQHDQQQQQEVDNYLYDIFRYCERILCPYRKKREDISQADIKSLAYITFRQEANQPQVMKLNPIDEYLFENQLNYTPTLTKQDQQIQQWPTRYIQSNQNIQIEQESFIIEFQNQFPKLFEQFSLILRQIVANNSQYEIFEPTTYQEKENILTISATFQNQHTSFKIQKFNTFEDAQEELDKIYLYQKQLNCISIQSLIKNQSIVSNEQGFFILTELNLSIMNEIKNLVEIKQSKVQINFQQDDYQIYIQGLQDLEKYIKFLLWLINNFQALLQLQVQPENMFISQDGIIYVNFNQICYPSILIQNQNQSLIQRFTQVAIDVFNLQAFQQMFQYNIFLQVSNQQQKIEKLIKNFFQSIDFQDKMWNQVALQELVNILNQLLNLKIINERFEQVNLRISKNSLENFQFQQNLWIYIQDSIKILKEIKNIKEIRNILQFDGQSIPSSIQNLFRIQFYQIENQINQNVQQKLIAFGQSIEQCLLIKQNLTDQQLKKIKELSLQALDKLYDLNNFRLKSANKDNSPICDCCKYQNRLEFFEFLKIVTMFYILVVIQDEQKQKSDEIQQKCLVKEIIELQNFLVKDQHQLKEITYEINDCQQLILELNQKDDFFDLKNKKSLVRLNATLHQLLVKDFYKQLKQNKHKINTLNIYIRSNNPFDNIQQGKSMFKKIPTLVQLL